MQSHQTKKIIRVNLKYDKKYIDGFKSKPHNSIPPPQKLISPLQQTDMNILHNVSNFYTKESNRSFFKFKMQFVDIKHIKIRRNLDQYFISPEC